MSRGKIKCVMIGVGEPIKGVGGCASTLRDGRTLIYEDGTTELCENQSIVLARLHKIFRSDHFKFWSRVKFN